MAFAWCVVGRTVDSIDTPLMHAGVLVPEDGASIGHMNEAAPNTMAYMGKLAEVHVLLKSASNRQMIQVVAMACAFGLLAIGFALFVMGIESAFEMNIESQAMGKVVLSATAPGLACFVLVALIVGITLATRGDETRTDEHQLRLRERIPAGRQFARQGRRRLTRSRRRHETCDKQKPHENP